MVSDPFLSLMLKIELQAHVKGLHEIVRLYNNIEGDSNIAFSSGGMIDEMHEMCKDRELPKTPSTDELIKVAVDTINVTIESQLPVARDTRLPRKVGQVAGAFEIPRHARLVSTVHNTYLAGETATTKNNYLTAEAQKSALGIQRHELKLEAQMEE